MEGEIIVHRPSPSCRQRRRQRPRAAPWRCRRYRPCPPPPSSPSSRRRRTWRRRRTRSRGQRAPKRTADQHFILGQESRRGRGRGRTHISARGLGLVLGGGHGGYRIVYRVDVLKTISAGLRQYLPDQSRRQSEKATIRQRRRGRAGGG